MKYLVLFFISNSVLDSGDVRSITQSITYKNDISSRTKPSELITTLSGNYTIYNSLNDNRNYISIFDN